MTKDIFSGYRRQAEVDQTGRASYVIKLTRIGRVHTVITTGFAKSRTAALKVARRFVRS